MPPINPATSFADYQKNYAFSVENSEAFWLEEGQRLQWITPYTQAKNTSYSLADQRILWFEDGTLNVCENCVDRHLPHQAHQPAIVWEGDNPHESCILTYQQLYENVCRFANGLKYLGIEKGDRVVIYLPMIPEAAVAMLACARLGAVHSVVFGGFSPESIASRVADCTPKVIITADWGKRGGKTLAFKENTDIALTLEGTSSVTNVVTIQRDTTPVAMVDGRDIWLHDLIANMATECPVTAVGAEDPLFILYTSGSTGKPKGVLHTSGGYLVYAAMTHQHIFNWQEGETYWCTADIGWVTGHTYVLYGPLANGATTLMFEGIPTYPTPSRFWEVIDKHQVNIFYTAPTAIRSLIRFGDDAVKSTKRTSLRLLGTVGEPIDPTSWQWYYDVVGEKNCPIADTWWQTETGGTMMSPLPDVTPLKPGSVTLPFYGVKPAILSTDGQELADQASGLLVIKDSWPGQARTLYGDHERFLQTYFSSHPGYYFTGDGARRDEDGYYWITGRVDDVINVSGHRIGTAEVESCLDANEAIVESAVVGFPHDIKGQGIYAYVVLQPGHIESEELKKELVQWVRHYIGAIATIDHIQITDNLPKTRSGKVMRRILRKIAANEFDTFGDTSTLLDPAVVDKLIAGRKTVV